MVEKLEECCASAIFPVCGQTLLSTDVSLLRDVFQQADLPTETPAPVLANL